LFYTRVYFSKNEKQKYLQDLKNRRIGIRNIPLDCSDRKLLSYFRQKYKVEKAYSLRNKHGKSVGTGFVIFPTVAETKKCIDESDKFGHPSIDGDIYLDIKIYKSWKVKATGGFFKEIKRETG
jgi:RNA recognition motif-containing protein